MVIGLQEETTVTIEREINWVILAVFAATYAAITIIIAPIAFLATQVRISDAMLMIPFHKKYGKEAVIGLTLGGFFANLVSPLGIIDWVFGPITNFLVALVVYIIGVISRNKPFNVRIIFAILAAVIGSVIIGILIGYELYLLGFATFIVGFIGVLIGSVISVGVGGVALISMMLRAIPEE